MMEMGIITKPAAWLYGEDQISRTDEVFMGWAVKILKEVGEAYEAVTHYGYHGYIKKENLLPCTLEEIRKRDAVRKTVWNRCAFADVKEEPDVRSKILCTLGRGSFVTKLHEVSNGYRKVGLANGEEGYIPDIFLEERRESDACFYEREPNLFLLRQGKKYLPEKKDFQKRLVACASAYLGTQYRWAGKSAEGIDCSGLTFMCYWMNGVMIYRDAEIKKEYPVHEISIERMEPGDLLYFPGHVALYIGDLKYIHATGNPKSAACVINSLSEKDPDYRADLASSLLKAGSIW